MLDLLAVLTLILIVLGLALVGVAFCLLLWAAAKRWRHPSIVISNPPAMIKPSVKTLQDSEWSK